MPTNPPDAETRERFNPVTPDLEAVKARVAKMARKWEAIFPHLGMRNTLAEEAADLRALLAHCERLERENAELERGLAELTREHSTLEVRHEVLVAQSAYKATSFGGDTLVVSVPRDPQPARLEGTL